MLGTISSVSAVELIRPLITAMAIGVRISAPSPRPRAIGVRPRTVVAVVIRIGRRRTDPAVTTASSRGIPLRRSVLM